MARTFRRKSGMYHYGWVLIDWSTYSDRELDRHSDEGKRRLARYHSDAGCGGYGGGTAPHWYRRHRNKLATNREKQCLYRWAKLGDEQYEVPKPVRVSDASWYW